MGGLKRDEEITLDNGRSPAYTAADFQSLARKGLSAEKHFAPFFKGRKAIYSGLIQDHFTESKPNFMQIKGQNDGGFGGRSSRVYLLSSGKKIAG